MILGGFTVGTLLVMVVTEFCYSLFSNTSKPKDREAGDDVDEAHVSAGLTFLSRNVGDELSVWDDPSDSTKTVKMICHGESLQPVSALPITAHRPTGNDKVGYAAQSFNIHEIPGVMSGWISGFVELPAGAIKDAEGVGECTQVYFIASCQVGLPPTLLPIFPTSLTRSLIV